MCTEEISLAQAAGGKKLQSLLFNLIATHFAPVSQFKGIIHPKTFKDCY